MASELATSNVTNLPISAHPGARTVSSWRGIRPTSMDEAWRMSKALAMSGMLPSSYTRGKQYDEVVGAVFAAIQMGAEVGLSPMSSIQNIAVINGKPGLFGPAMLAVVEASGLLQNIEEAITGTMAEKNMEAICTVQRYGRQPRTFTFSFADATLAGLIGKSGPWSQYPKRMFIARARTFALRDTFPDVLAGLSQSVEELIDIPAEDYREIKVKVPLGESLDDLLEPPEPEAPITPEYIVEFEASVIDQLDGIATVDALDDLWRSGINAEIRKIGEIDKAAQKRLIAAFSAKKNEILAAGEAGKEDDKAEAPATAPQKPAQADQTTAAAKSRDQIDNALDALRKGDDEPEKATRRPPPAKIEVGKKEDGSDDLFAFYTTAKAQLKAARDGDYGDAWVEAWAKANNDSMAALKPRNLKAWETLSDGYAEVLEHQTARRKEAEAEVLKEFPTIPFQKNSNFRGYKGTDPDGFNWSGFLNHLRVYLDDTPNHRIARAWWTNHSFQVGVIERDAEQVRSPFTDKVISGKAAAAEFKAELFARFPQLSD